MRIQSVQSIGSPTIADYYMAAKNEIGNTIGNYPQKELLGMETDELTEYLYQEHALSLLVVDETRQIEWEKVVKKEKRTTFRGTTATVEVNRVRITLPIKPGLKLKESLQYPAKTITIAVYEFDLDESNYTVSFEDVPENIERAIDNYKNVFAQRTFEIDSENAVLKPFIRSSIEQRKKKIMEDNEILDSLIQKITIPLKKREEPTDYQVPLQVRTDLKKLSHPEFTTPKDLVLTQEQLDSIIKVIDVDGKNFENAPETYSQLDEPDLRNVIVGHLNHYFPDDATGETFVKLGKADIRLKVSEGEILIAECKYWSGEEEYSRAIDQLFRYLTWRHNYGLVIVFSKNVGFTDVLDKIKEATQKHTSYQGGFTELGKTHFRSVHNFPDDPQKKIELHVLVYNLYFNKERNS